MADKITVISRWESSQMDAQLEYKMMRQLKGAFHIDRLIYVPGVLVGNYTFEQYETMEEALDALAPETTRCFLEPSGYKGMYDLPHGDIAFILGNTEQSNIHHAHVDETYAIKTEGSSHLYGLNALTVALAYEYGQ